MYNRSKLEKDISYSDVLQTIEQSNGKECVFENCCIATQNDNGIGNKEFKNVAFINCKILYPHVHDCRFINCKFVDCMLFDAKISSNKIIDSKVEGIEFQNNTEIRKNTLDGVTGYLEENQWLIYNGDNHFKNMDFSGFLPAYTNMDFGDFGDCNIVCKNNYFHNVSVNIEAIERLSNRATILHTRENGCEPELCREMYDDQKNLVAIKFLRPVSLIVNLQNMDPETRLNLVASIVTHNFNGSFIRDLKTQSNSIHNLYSTPNPQPARIVDSRGYYLKDGVIKSINIETNYKPMYERSIYTCYDGANIEKCSEENSLHNPNNYVKSL